MPPAATVTADTRIDHHHLSGYPSKYTHTHRFSFQASLQHFSLSSSRLSGATAVTSCMSSAEVLLLFSFSSRPTSSPHLRPHRALFYDLTSSQLFLSTHHNHPPLHYSPSPIKHPSPPAPHYTIYFPSFPRPVIDTPPGHTAPSLVKLKYIWWIICHRVMMYSTAADGRREALIHKSYKKEETEEDQKLFEGIDATRVWCGH